MTFATLITIVLVIAVLPSIADCAFRIALALAARRGVVDRSGDPPGPCLAVIPSRQEGESVRDTLSSVVGCLRPGDDVLLLLDGGDPVAEAVARELNVSTVTKEPGGPTKGIALSWLVAHHRDRLASFDSVMVLDAGSALGSGFFADLTWPGNADAVQSCLTGTGTGIAEAAALSERRAQRWEDRGRQALGWNAKLRGTGMLLKAAAFIETIPSLRSKVEDWEMTLLLTAHGRRIVLGPDDVRVHDVKPSDVHAAAAQRARWLVGQFSLLVLHRDAIAALLRRAPLEGTAFVAELFSRPRSLSVLLRLAAAAWIAVAVPSPPASAFAGLLVGTLIIDVGLLFLRDGGGARSAGLLALAWMRALVLLPAALGSWLRGRRP